MDTKNYHEKDTITAVDRDFRCVFAVHQVDFTCVDLLSVLAFGGARQRRLGDRGLAS